MTPRGRRGLRIGIVSLFFAGVLVFGYLLRDIFNPLLVALLIAYICDPFIGLMERKGIPRKWGVTGIYAVGIVGVLLFGGLLTTTVIAGVADLHESTFKPGGYLDQLEKKLEGVDWDSLLGDDSEPEGGDTEPPSGGAGGEAPPPGEGEKETSPGAERAPRGEELTSIFQQVRRVGEAAGAQIRGFVLGLLNTAAATIRGVFLVLSYTILVPVYCFFLMLSLDRIRKSTSEHLPGLHRERILGIFGKIDRSVSAFFRGRLIICLIKGIFIAIGLWICGVQFAIPIGLLAGVATIIPFLGGLIASVPSIVIVLLDYPDPWVRMVGVLVVVMLSEGFEGLVLTPAILSKETGLHPLTLLLSIFVAGEVFGFFGILLAVPIASIVKILFAEFVLPEIRALAREKPDPAPDG